MQLQPMVPRLINAKPLYLLRLVKDQTASSPKDQRQATTLVSELSTFKIRGGGRRDRTDDPLLAKQVLSQLSYAPNKAWWVR